MKNYQITTVIPSIFRAYDIRGIVDQGISENEIYTIARAIGSEIKAKNKTEVIVGRDARLSSEALALALIAGLRASGVDVINIGEVPTPVLYFATHRLSANSGVMLTASHNPAEYNGLKMIIDGQTLAQENIQKLYQRIGEGNFTEGAGLYREESLVEDYLNAITQTVHLSRPLKIVLDCGNGVAGNIAPELYRRLGCEVIELFCEVDGRFPNHHPDPTVPENLQDAIAALRLHKADLALALDGDADRLGVVSDQGKIIWADRQLMLYAIDVLSRNKHAKILYDVKCSRHLKPLIEAHGGVPVMWKTGHALLKLKMKEINAELAGEMSGHIFFKERWFGFDDGLYTGARLLEIISQRQESVDNIFAALPDSMNTPELKLPVLEQEKFSIMEQIKNQTSFFGADIVTIDGLRVEFEHGWGLIRPSNTSPYLILRFEADNDDNLQSIMQVFRTQLLKVNPQFQLPF